MCCHFYKFEQTIFMDINPIILSIPIYFILIGIELLYDRVKNKKLYRLNDAFSNISCGIVEQVSGVFGKVFTIGVYYLVFESFHFFKIPETWYFTVLLFIGVDFFYYWAHRMSHEVNLFWLGHVVHHQSEEYNLSVALRQGSFQKVFTVAFYLPLAIIGFQPEWFLFVGAFTTLYQFWIHTETIRHLPKWFEYIFNTPSHHRVHHGKNPEYIDKNHGGTFIIWDRIFGTFEPEKEKVIYGVTRNLSTFNPIKAHTQPFADLWTDIKNANGLGNKWKTLWKNPGWTADPAPRTETKKISFPAKFNINQNAKSQWYLFTQFVAFLAIVAFYLFSNTSMITSMSGIVAVVLLAQAFFIGWQFDKTAIVTTVELGRLILLSLVLFFLFGGNELLLWSMSGLLLASLIWLMSLNRNNMAIHE